ncbi:MAG: hypothetical protein RL376_1572, partial [Verrucomicrobiota bacterium]
MEAMKRVRSRFRLGLGVVVGVLSCVAIWEFYGTRNESSPVVERGKPLAGEAGVADFDSGWLEADGSDVAGLADKLRARFRRPHVRADEVVLVFKDATARRSFEQRAAGAGVVPLAGIEALQAVRARVSDYAAFARELGAHAGDYATVGANVVLEAPVPPRDLERTMAGASPVGGDLLATLGVRGDNARWGEGVVVAVLD